MAQYFESAFLCLSGAVLVKAALEFTDAPRDSVFILTFGLCVGAVGVLAGKLIF